MTKTKNIIESIISDYKLNRFKTTGFIIPLENKLNLLLYIIHQHLNSKILIYTNTNLVSEWLHYKLMYNDVNAYLFKTKDLNINKNSNQLMSKLSKTNVLIVTDQMIPYLQFYNAQCLIHFDIPTQAKIYFLRLAIINTLENIKTNYLFICEEFGYYLLEINEYLKPSLKIQSIKPDPKYLSHVDLADSPFSDPLFMQDPILIKNKTDWNNHLLNKSSEKHNKNIKKSFNHKKHVMNKNYKKRE